MSIGIQYLVKVDRTWLAWKMMHYNPLGIEVCGRWEYYNNFRQDMGKCEEGKVLMSKIGSKILNKDNCYWGTSQDVRITDEFKEELKKAKSRDTSHRSLSIKYNLSVKTIAKLLEGI